MAVTKIPTHELPDHCASTSAAHFFREAIKCLGVGTHRAALQMLWIAIVIDGVEKIQSLSSDGDDGAKSMAQEINHISTAIESGDPLAFRRAGAFESSIPERLLKLQQISAQEKEVLERLQTDRNRAAHPSFELTFGAFEPTDDLVRAHIRAAFDIQLSRHATPGRAAIDKAYAVITGASFPTSKVAASTILRGIIGSTPRVAIVHGIADKLLFSDELKDSAGDRGTRAMLALLAVDRETAASHVAAKLSKYAPGADDSVNLWMAKLLSCDPEIAENVEEPAIQRMRSVIEHTPISQLHSIFENKGLLGEFADALKISLMNANPKELDFFAELPPTRTTLEAGVDKYLTARNWTEANAIYSKCVAPFAARITFKIAERVIEAAASGAADLRGSHGFRSFLKSAYSNTVQKSDLLDMLRNHRMEKYISSLEEPEDDWLNP